MTGVSFRAAAVLFAALLHLLPRDLRRAYGAEMREDFAAAVSARGAVWSTWSRCVLDLLKRIPTEWNVVNRGSDRAQPTLLERMHTMLLEFGQAARSLAKRPGFTLVTVLTLALGIGANVAIFAIVNSVLVQPLPYPDADRIVAIQHHAPGLDFENLDNSPGTQALYREHARSFSSLATVEGTQRNLTGGREPARVSAILTTASLFDVLRVSVALGRPLLESDEVEGASPVAVLTHSAWQTHFGGAGDVIGRTVALNGVATEIVGVLPREYRYPDAETALLLPLIESGEPQFGSFGAQALARLRPGVDLAGAEAELKSLQPRMMERFELPATFVESTGWDVSLATLRDRTVGDAASMLWIVFGAVSFLLLVACASVANLFLVRAESRQREVGIRLALGSPRGRVLRLVLRQGVLLALLGVGIGLVMTLGVARLLESLLFGVPGTDLLALGGAAALLLLAALVASWVPALRASRVHPAVALKMD